MENVGQRFTAEEERFMDLAFAEARKVKGKTLPNPPVGAVVVRGGRVLAKGGTRPAGQAHAEVTALERAGAAAAGATLYVTLEPCCHFGKTPPCTRAILAAGIAKVVIPVTDPFHLVEGGGVRELRRSGVRVELGLRRQEALDFYEGFFFWARRERPLIHLKIAQSLDGRVNASPSEKTLITGRPAQRWSHGLRARVDGILIGAGTARADDPDLTPRLARAPHPECLVLSRTGIIPAGMRLLAPGRKARTVVLTPASRAFPEWVDLELLPAPAGKQVAGGEGGTAEITEIAENLLRIFRKRGYHSVLVEGGPAVWSIFLAAGLWDRLHILSAPKLLPGGQRWDSGLPAGWGKGLIFHKFACLGADMLWTAENPAPV